MLTMTDTAVALLRTGERIPLSESVKRALELFADRQYDADVVAIEAEPVSQPVPPPIQPMRQEALL